MSETERVEPLSIQWHERTAERGLTVGQLRAALAAVPDDVEVVLSSDGEGNSKSPLADASSALYTPDTTWSGDTYVFDSQIGRDGFTDEDRAPSDAYPVVVLWPTN